MTTFPLALRGPAPRPTLFARLNPPLRLAGVISAAMILPTLALLVLDGRVLDDEALWLKPLKFQLSMATLALTVAAAPMAFDRAAGQMRAVRWAAVATTVAILYELFFLSLQAGRGVRSHFNDTTLFDRVGGSIMAAGAGVLVAGPAIIGIALVIRAWRRAELGPLHLSVGAGLAVGGVLAAMTGSALGANGGPFIGADDPADAVWPLFGWSREIGDLRIAHFLGLHMMQALPVLTAVTLRLAGRPAAWLALLGGGAAWTAATVLALSRAQAGLPLF